MLDKYILDWAPAKTFPVDVRSLGRHGPYIVQTTTFGSGGRNGSWLDALVDELPFISAKVVTDSDTDIAVAVPPSVKAWRLSHANAKIRREAKISQFQSSNGSVGALHAARLPSNLPCEDEWDSRTAGGLVYAGIYDGHAGSATAKALKSSLIPFVAREVRRVGKESAPDKIDDVVKAAFVKLDNTILNNAEAALVNADPCDPDAMAALAPTIAGSCALLSMYDPVSCILRVACVGDSRAVLGSYKGDVVNNEDDEGSKNIYEARALSEDQTAANMDEVARIKAAHPGEEDDHLFQWGRFLGIMVTRAFGDHRWKWNAELVEKVYLEFLGHQTKPGILTPPYLTAEPVVTCTPVASRDFVILASDGFWDHVAAEDAVLLVAQWLEKKKSQKLRGHSVPDDTRAADNSTQSTCGTKLDLDFDEQGFAAWKTLPQHFVVEDMDNAAVHLLKNALGGNRRNLFVASTMMEQPLSRNIRDDITVQVLFFQQDTV